MLGTKVDTPTDINPQETSEWLEALDGVVEEGGAERASYLLERLVDHAAVYGIESPHKLNTPYVNTIPAEEEEPYPGDRAIERRIKSLIRWNAMAMVVQANKHDAGIGGHIATYASLATLQEVGHNHFFHGRYDDQPGDFIYFQGHASPGTYARAFLEGRLTEKHLENFRHELREHAGLSSYPHPWLMPDFWQFPTVSMGLGPINSIYQARFMRYLENRGIIPQTPRKIWAFVGDGESDEPETLGAITLASRERLDNLIFVVNCNLQRLDGPVRGNGQIITELEAAFRGAGWNVIKVLWGASWDDLLARDTTGLLIKRMGEAVDGEYQAFKAKDGAYVRKEFFGKYPELLKLVEHMSDEEIFALRRGGHDPQKVYNAYKRAVEHTGSPTVILAKTIKGYGMGEAGEGRMVTHQQKKMNEKEMVYFSKRFEVPVTEETAHTGSFFKPPEDSPEMKYIRERVEAMGGSLPARNVGKITIQAPPVELFAESVAGSGGREVSTTMAFVRVLTLLLKDHALGKYIVPIIPDEARTFGMESLFRQYGIYASRGQLYKPVDAENFLFYKETRDGQIIEEGITEAGSMASFIAAGSAYATHGINTIPFFIYYSMFGLQRISDFIWAAADMRCRGFMLGGTAGRTTLAGEGLQHQDGNSHILALPIPTMHAYDPAFAFEIAVIIQDGIRRMYKDGENIFYYITVMNEPYAMPAMPAGVEDGILRGMYKFRASEIKNSKLRAQLFGSGAILREALKAQEILGEKYGVSADVWSVTSYKSLYTDGIDAERWNLLHSGEKPRVPYVSECLANADGVLVAATDYLKALPNLISKWTPRRLASLGTDGFGRSENRAALRDFFEVDARFIALATLYELFREGKIASPVVQKAIQDLEIDLDKPNPLFS